MAQPTGQEASPPLQLHVFGGFRLERDGRDAAPRSRKARGLIGYLAVSRGRVASRERIADLLWSDRGVEQARGSLRQTLTEVRAAGLGTVLVSQRDAVALNPDSLVCDLDQILAAAARSDVAALAERMEQVSGDFLADLSGLSPGYDDWLFGERVQQGERVVSAVLATSGAMITHPRLTDIHAILRALDRLDPWNEAVARLGMRADSAAGDSASLHRRYRRLVDGLASEFQTAPSEETRALFDQLTRAEAPPPAPVAPSPSPAPPAPAPETAERRSPPMVLVSPLAAADAGEASAEVAAIITDDLRTALGQIREFRVLALDTQDLERVRRACVGAVAAYMLSGRVRQVGGEMRVNLQIGHVGSDVVVWSEQLRVDQSDLGQAIDHVVARAAGAVLPSIDRDLPERVPQGPEADEGAAALYAAARGRIRRARTLAEAQAGAAMLDEVIVRDPGHIGARTLLITMYNTDFWQRMAGHDVAAYRARALALAQEAAALEPTDPRIQVRLAWCHLRQGNVRQAERRLREVVPAFAHDADGLNQCAFGFTHLGELETAAPLMQRAFLLNPFAPADYHADHAVMLTLRGEPEEAEDHFDVSGEQGLQYLAVRLANLSRLGEQRPPLVQTFLTGFAAAWQPTRPYTLDDILGWARDTLPFQRPEHAALLADGLNGALATSLGA